MLRHFRKPTAEDPDRHALWLAMARALEGEKADFSCFSDSAILQLADNEGVCQLLDMSIRCGAVTGVDDATAQALANKTREQVAVDMLQSKDTRKVLDLFATNGIPALLLKGAPLACLYYEKSYQRPRTDTDLYINDADVDLALDVLVGQGFSIHREEKRKLASKQFVASISSFQNISSHFDIHWKLSNRILFRQSLPFEECYKSRQAVEPLGENAFTLSSIDLLLHACIHRIAHGRNTERNRLIWLYDIHLLAQSMDDSEKEHFGERALQKAIGFLCADAVRLTGQMFGTRLPNGWLEKLESNADNEPTARLIHASKPRWAWADLMALEGISNKVKYAAELLFH